MFKIDFLKLNYNINIAPTIYNFSQSTYIYGKNNVGKTVMVNTIDFILGNSELQLESKEGLDNIESVEAKLTYGNKSLYLKRTITNEFGYKYNLEESYLVSNLELYKERITNLIFDGNHTDFELLKEYIQEETSFRTFTFLNFVDEKGLGNLSGIFTRAKEYKHIIRLRKLMDFIFNYSNIVKILELERYEKATIDRLDQLRDIKKSYNYFLSIIKREFFKLQLRQTDDVDEMRKIFNQYIKGFNREKNNSKVANGDLGYLLGLSYALSEEIKYQRNLQQQATKIQERNSRSKRLLNAFAELLTNHEEYSEYVNEINYLINKFSNDNDILSVKDYEKTIKTLENKKTKYDSQIANCTVGLSKSDYEDTIKSIGLIENAFLELSYLNKMDEIFVLENRLKEVKSKLKDIKQEFDDTLKQEFDSIILDYYKGIDSNIQFVKEDLNKLGFCIDFNPSRITMTGLKAKYEEDQMNMLIAYNPGSMARETTWQILAYLTMHKLIGKYFRSLPILPILIIDGLNQPFDETPNCYSGIYQFIQSKAKELGLQLIVVSTKEGKSIGADDQIDLSMEGFNRAHNIA